MAAVGLQLTRGSARKTLHQMGLSDGDIISVKPRDGGPAPSMVGLSSRRSLSRTSMNKMGSFQKKGSFVKNNASQANLVSGRVQLHQFHLQA